FSGAEEPAAPRFGRELVEEPAHRAPIVRSRSADGGDGAVTQHETWRGRIVEHGWRRRDRMHQTLATATSASGMTNSCSGWRTVSTGHGAVRTTRSATLPIS